MKIAKVIIPLLLIAATPGTAFANGNSGQTMDRCRMDFPVRWTAWQFIPCWAARVFM